MDIDTLKAIIDANVYTNHDNEVTAEMVKAALYALADAIGGGNVLESAIVEEDGLYFVDGFLNIGMSLTSQGVNGIGFISAREV